MTAAAIATETVTLSHRLGEGRISFTEALRYSTILAETIRQIHDSGRTCGALQPSNIVLTGSGLELLPTEEAGAVTPYTAPEILQGRTPDARSDIFAFGAIVYEMITGRRAFTGDNADALAVALTISVPAPSGVAAVDHLVSHCLAKDPSVRCSRMQKVILELKLLGFAEAPARQVATATLRAEAQQLEARMAVLIESHEEAINHIQQAHTALDDLREQVTNLRAELGSAQERLGRTEQDHAEQVSILRSQLTAAQERASRAEQDHAEQVSILKSELATALERLVQAEQDRGEQVAGLRSDFSASQERASRAEQEQGEQNQRILAAVEQVQQGVQAVDQRVNASESGVEVLGQRMTMMQEYQAGRLQEFEQTLRSQSSQIALVSAGQAQTDDLVEGVVAAMEVLQSSVFDFSDR